MYGSLDVDCDTSDSTLFSSIAQKLPDDGIWATSTLRRTHQTADALIAAGAKPSSRVEDADILEQDFGEYNGMPLTELFALRDDAYLGFWPNASNALSSACTMNIAAKMSSVSLIAEPYWPPCRSRLTYRYATASVSISAMYP